MFLPLFSVALVGCLAIDAKRVPQVPRQNLQISCTYLADGTLTLSSLVEPIFIPVPLAVGSNGQLQQTHDEPDTYTFQSCTAQSIDLSPSKNGNTAMYYG
jgi:hypothetical protein